MGTIYFLIVVLILYIVWPEKRPRVERAKRRITITLPWF